MAEIFLCLFACLFVCSFICWEKGGGHFKTTNFLPLYRSQGSLNKLHTNRNYQKHKTNWFAINFIIIIYQQAGPVSTGRILKQQKVRHTRSRKYFRVTQHETAALRNKSARHSMKLLEFSKTNQRHTLIKWYEFSVYFLTNVSHES